MIRKALRNKDVRVNGNKIKDDVILQKNDCVEIFLPNDFSKQNVSKTELQVVFEDENIIK